MRVLVGGWPGSGTSTLATALAAEMELPLLAKDEIKETLADALGHPDDVEASRRLGRAAVLTLLHVAQRLPGAVLDSTWFEYMRPLVERLPRPVVEVRCTVPHEVARAQYLARAVDRHGAHLDLRRDDEDLWGTPFVPLGVGPVVDVDTDHVVDVPGVAAAMRSAFF